MKSNEILAAGVVVLGAAAGNSLGQCSPSWDTTIGAVGLTSDGYAGPMTSFDDGHGEALYIGGSFSSAGGYLTRGLARYAGGDDWHDVGGGCYSPNTNYFVAALAVHNFGVGPELISGGGFATAGGVAGTANLAAWNGSRWRALGAPGGAVWSLVSSGGVLYVAGGFTQIGGIAANGIASYDGEVWSALGSGMAGGFSPNVFAMKVFNDGSGEKLYAGGRFASLGGVNGLVARWNGTAWQPVGRGVQGTNTFSDVEAMAIYNDGTRDTLCVGGWDLRPVGGTTTVNVLKWDGTRWSTLGQYLGGRTTALAVFDDGSGAKPGTQPSTCPMCSGSGRVRAAQGFFSIERTCPTCQGKGSVITDPCDECRKKLVRATYAVRLVLFVVATNCRFASRERICRSQTRRRRRNLRRRISRPRRPPRSSPRRLPHSRGSSASRPIPGSRPSRRRSTRALHGVPASWAPRLRLSGGAGKGARLCGKALAENAGPRLQRASMFWLRSLRERPRGRDKSNWASARLKRSGASRRRKCPTSSR